jgi:hypothetical protein
MLQQVSHMHIPRLGVKAELVVFFPRKGITKERTEERLADRMHGLIPLLWNLIRKTRAYGRTISSSFFSGAVQSPDSDAKARGPYTNTFSG